MFRENLKDQIEYKGLLVKELSAITGINKQTLDSYLNVRAVLPNAEIAVKLAQALDTTVEYLVTGKNAKQKLNTNAERIAYDKHNTELFRKYKKVIYDLEELNPESLRIVTAMIAAAVGK